MAHTYVNAVEAYKILDAQYSPREAELLTLERYVCGTQYDGRPDWFDAAYPLFQRAPCIVYPLFATAIRSNVDLVLGESRFPALTANPGEDDSDEGGLDEDKSERLDAAIEDLFKRARYRAVVRQAFAHAQGEKSVAVIVGARKGKPFLETVRARWCMPELDVDGTCTRLVIQYPYLEPERQRDGTWKLNVRLYRRVVDAVSDTTFRPVTANPNGQPPKDEAWQVDPSRTVASHGLGFCPVVWYPHMRECNTVADVDGEAIHEHLLDEGRALDFALSMRHRAVLYTGSPQIIETGVERGYNPSGESGDAGAVPGTPLESGATPSAYRDHATKPGRIMSPGIVWSYESKDTRVDYLVLPPGAIEALDHHIADLRNKISEALAVVILDPENVKYAAAMSGKAVEALRARQFDRCDEFRDDAGNGLLIPVANMLLRVAIAAKLQIKSLMAVASDLTAMMAAGDSDTVLSIKWPNGYLAPDASEELAIVQATSTAKLGGFVSTRTAVQKTARIFGVDNVDQAVDALEEEADANAQKSLESAKALSDIEGDAGGSSTGDKKDKPE